MRKIFALLILTHLFSSCAPSYVPNTINTPLLSYQGEFQCAVYTGTAGVDVQMAYAASGRFGLMMNGSFANRNSETDEVFHKHTFIEAGAGYYRNLGQNGRFETFGGIGFGTLQAEYENSLFATSSNVNSRRLFLQPSIGISTAFFDGSFSARLIHLHLDQNSIVETGVFVEPALTAKFGPRKIKGVFQLGLSYPVNQNVNINYQPLLVSVGLHAKLNQ